MGNTKTKSPTLSKPWRTINWREKNADLQFMKDYSPLGGQHIRILLYGPVGSGKSSFINSVQSVLHGRMYTQALATSTSQGCFTKEYTTYKIQKDANSVYPFVFNDIMGVSTDRGVLEEDVKLALKGHIKDGYRFNPESSISPNESSFYNKSPNSNDMVHVLVCVVPANTVHLLDDKVIEKLKKIRKEASEMKIPQVVIFSKIDEFCSDFKDDVKKVYTNADLKEKMEILSTTVGVPMNCIYPVKNYHEEINLKDEMDSLILSAMKNIINYGNDCLHFRQSRQESV